MSETIYARWFTLPYIVLLLPIPTATLLVFFICWRSLNRLPKRLAEGNRCGEWVPFSCVVCPLLPSLHF
jgi:cytochrome bd ubiquinol oxidase subunit II